VTVNIIPFCDRFIQYFDVYPRVSDTGEIHIQWESLHGATSYSIYREIFEITDVSSLTPIYTAYDVDDWVDWVDFISVNGTYYYVIVANNGTVDSDLSDCRSVEVAIIPFSERKITYFHGDTQLNYEWIYFNWNDIHGAQYYEIFRSTSPITDLSGLDVFTTDESYWQDNIPYNGTFYYVVRAFNGSISTPISICIMIEQIFLPFDELDTYFSTMNSYDDGRVYLRWREVPGAETYEIYRDTSEITDITSMTPIHTSYSQWDTTYNDYVDDRGLYYYVILATDGIYTSKISNCESVTVNIIPFCDRFIQYFDVYPRVSDTGEIHIQWESLHGATSYSIYREIFEITDVSSLTPIYTAYDVDDWVDWVDFISVNGTYYYVIVANNGTVDSDLSDCRSVEVAIIPFSERKITYFHGDTQLNYEWIYFNWNDIHGAQYYEIFRSTSPITDLSGLDVFTTDESYWQDNIP